MSSKDVLLVDSVERENLSVLWEPRAYFLNILIASLQVGNLFHTLM